MSESFIAKCPACLKECTYLLPRDGMKKVESRDQFHVRFKSRFNAEIYVCHCGLAHVFDGKIRRFNADEKIWLRDNREEFEDGLKCLMEEYGLVAEGIG